MPQQQMSPEFADLCHAAEFGLLGPDGSTWSAGSGSEPAYFGDLHLDQVVARVVGERDVHALAPVYWTLPDDEEVVRYRQAVFADLARPEVHELMATFSARLGRVLGALRTSSTMSSPFVAHRWQLRAAEVYQQALDDLAAGLSTVAPAAEGLSRLGRHASRLVDSSSGVAFAEHVAGLQSRLREVDFNVYLAGPRVVVGARGDEPGIEQEVFDAFARFRSPTRAGETPAGTTTPQGYDPVRDRIVEQVARLHPQLVEEVAATVRAAADLVDPTLAQCYRDLQFYLRYLEVLAPLEAAGAQFCTTPAVVFGTGRTPVRARSTYDLALALTLGDLSLLVANDLDLGDSERTLVVTGPNNGGKTTMARTIGQLCHLAALGCPVPGQDVVLPAPDAIFTHFERAEVVNTRASKLEADLRHLADVLDRASSRSLVILNETFSSTTAQDALELGAALLRRLGRLGALCVYVTFIDELSRVEEDTVSMTSMVDPDDPARRTFRVVRRRADGRAYAESLARAHRLSYQQVRRSVTA